MEAEQSAEMVRGRDSCRASETAGGGGGAIRLKSSTRPDHSAWANGTSSTLFDVLGRSAPVSLLSAGIIRVEHVCPPSDADHDFDFVPFPELAKAWSLPTSRKVMADLRSLVHALKGAYVGVMGWWPLGDYRYSSKRQL